MEILMGIISAMIAALWAAPVLAASPFPPKPVGVTTVLAKDGNGSSVSYKETHICETTPGVKSYSGYVHLPSTLVGEDFNINTFYWFVEARKSPETAPLALYLAGGPGESSMFGAMGQGGPCYINDDYNTTTLNEWSWNNEVNMLYIDQPVQTGFSYDTLVNGTLNQLTSQITLADFSKGVPKTNDTFLVGTFPSQNPSHVTQGSVRGANALWEFMQIWTAYFPKNRSNNTKISMWANSWGGFYSTQTFAFFERQNEKIRAQGDNSTSAHLLDLDTLGITNGCIDPLLEGPHYPEMAIHNTYGYQAYSQEVYNEALNNFTKPHGCRALAQKCQTLAAIGDPDYQGTNQTVNRACGTAFVLCFLDVQGAYVDRGKMHSAFDMAHQALDPFPDYRTGYYLNQAWVQRELGVPLNYTPISNVVDSVYSIDVGDALRSNISALSYTLSHGYKVALVYGDRDYRCNWLGAENVSLSADWTHDKAFNQAGYADLVTNDTYKGGFVRQVGGLSFSRVFQAGHAVMSYQPETVYRVFQRAMFGRDVATGTENVGAGNASYATRGPKTVRKVTESFPPMPPLDCDLWAVDVRCSSDQVEALVNGTAVVRGAKVVKPAT